MGRRRFRAWRQGGCEARSQRREEQGGFILHLESARVDGPLVVSESLSPRQELLPQVIATLADSVLVLPGCRGG